MTEERREGYVDLGKKLDAHISRFDQFEEESKARASGLADGTFKLHNGMTLVDVVEEHKTLQAGQVEIVEKLDEIVEELVGVPIEDYLTGDVTYKGGMRQSMQAFEDQASNGGVNAKVKWTKTQTLAVTVGIPAITSVFVAVIMAVGS